MYRIGLYLDKCDTESHEYLLLKIFCSFAFSLLFSCFVLIETIKELF
jgi:hypothetical protein